VGHQIIKQPNGFYAVFSSIVDDFILLDATPDEIIEDEVADARRTITEYVRRKVAALNRGEKPYYQFTMTWKQALKERRGKEPIQLRRKPEER
jgi:hypothetical protein